MRHRAGTRDRNREMIAIFEAGGPIELLMARYKLSENRVRAILADEKNRRLTSPDPYYRSKRMEA